MYHDSNNPRTPTEQFLAELTDAAYRVALRHGLKGSFIDIELDLWATLRSVLAGDPRIQRPSRADKAETESDDDEETRTPGDVEPRWLTRQGVPCTA